MRQDAHNDRPRPQIKNFYSVPRHSLKMDETSKAAPVEESSNF